jgi:hypothetical protein
MNGKLVDLWPDDISTDVLSPQAILKFQAAQLEKRTKGILRGRVEEVINDEEKTLILVIEAPAVSITGELLRVVSKVERAYPVKVYGPGMAHVVADADCEIGVQDYKVANGEGQLIELVREVLAAGETRATLDSLIALSNEANSPGEPAVQ